MPRNRSEKITPETQILIGFRKELVEYIAVRQAMPSGDPERTRMYHALNRSIRGLPQHLKRLTDGHTWRIILATVESELNRRGVKYMEYPDATQPK